MTKFRIHNLLIPLTLFGVLNAPVLVQADVNERFPRAEQAAFTQRYDDARAAGEEAYDAFCDDIEANGSNRELQMLTNLQKGKTADGKKNRPPPPPPPGFMGDPNDPGPTDWSDWNIETDPNGNVTGFKPKDYYDADANGDGQVTDQESLDHERSTAQEHMDKNRDGQVSDAEREEAISDMDQNNDGEISRDELEEWNDRKDKEQEARDNGGHPPGKVPPIAEWDKNNDGKPDPGFELDCWRCMKPVEELAECVDGAPGPCDSHACDQDEKCVEHKETHKGKEYTCHNCVTQTPWCDEQGYFSDPSCDGKCEAPMCVEVDVDKKTGKIVPPMKTRERGSTQKCYTCLDPEACPDGTIKGICPGSCSSAEKCLQVDDKCYKCEPKTCAHYALLDDCSSCDPQKHDCVDVVPQPGLTCKECRPRTALQPECEDGLMKGTCPGTCSSSQKCVQADNNCYSCEEKDCDDFDLPTDCSACDPATQECIDVSPQPGLTCKGCKDKPVTPPPPECPQGASPGACTSSSCSSQEECVAAGENCHRCRPKKKTCEDMGMTDGEGCMNSGCIQDGGKCVQKTQDDYGVWCWACEKPTTQPPPPEEPEEDIIGVPGGEVTQCDGGYSPGSCASQMECFPGECYETAGPCFMCRKGDCHEPYFRQAQCMNCVERGGKCMPAGAHIASGIRGIAENYQSLDDCYKCEFPESCEKYGELSSCQMCRPGTVCVPGRTITDGYEQFRCVNCIRPTSIEVTYIVIIIETPRGRFILDKGKGGMGAMGNFIPSQVMALAQVTDPGQAAQRIAGMLPGASSAFGMLQSSMSMGGLSSLLTQGMEKGGKYADNCFEKDFKQEEMPKSVPPSGTGGKTSGGQAAPAAASSEFGEDPTKQMSTGGPIVSCGTIGKEKALAILDAHGRPIEFITQKMLKDDPNALMNALQKAQTVSEELLALREGGMKGLLQRLGQKTIDKVTSKLQEKVEEKINKKKKAKDEERIAIVPNDPFYPEPSKEEKDKLFGIFGSSKSDEPIMSIGSSMRMGTRVLGGGANAEKKEEVIKHQWGLHAIGFTPLSDPNSAWNAVDEEKKNILVAVIDSGLDLNHPDGPHYIWTNEGEVPDNGIDDDNNGYIDDVHGWNFLDGNNDVNDLEGHGTFVAGIIAAKTNNGIGIAGINPGAVIMPVKVADANGETNSFLIARAIFYAVDNGAKVINLSLGAAIPSALERAALQYAYARGVFVAVASGNIGEFIGNHGPASEKGAVAVGATDFEGGRSTISNWGANNALLAPGDSIMSLLAQGTGKKLLPSMVKQGYYPRSGTSFSTPMVAATASLLLVQNPHLSPEEIEDILHRTADEMYEEGWDGMSGAGLLNAAKALRLDVNDKLTVKVSQTRINRSEKNKIESVDVFGTVRGNFKEFTVELGKGKHAGRFEKIAGPFTQQANFDWLAHLPQKDYLRGSDEWIVRIRAVDQSGAETIAQTLLELK